MADKPNFLIIWGDDIGYWNISAYSKGMMGYKTTIDTLQQARQTNPESVRYSILANAL